MEASIDLDREIMSWAEFGEASRALAQQIADSGFRPDLVLAIARGGLTVAGALAYALSVKNCFAMNVEFYTGVDERIDVPVMLPPMLDLVDIAGLSVLVADDVADTGLTMQLVHSVIAEHVGEARTAVLYQKSRSVIDADYVFRSTDRWINFPWSTEPPVLVSPPGAPVPTGGAGSSARRGPNPAAAVLEGGESRPSRSQRV